MQMQFSADGAYLYAGARKDNGIVCYDLRKTMAPLFTLHRPADTNQRLYFDIHPESNRLLAGDTDGRLLVFDLAEQARTASGEPALCQQLFTKGIFLVFLSIQKLLTAFTRRVRGH